MATRNRSRLENQTLVLDDDPSRRPVGLGADMIDLGAPPPIHTTEIAGTWEFGGLATSGESKVEGIRGRGLASTRSVSVATAAVNGQKQRSAASRNNSGRGRPSKP